MKQALYSSEKELGVIKFVTCSIVMSPRDEIKNLSQSPKLSAYQYLTYYTLFLTLIKLARYGEEPDPQVTKISDLVIRKKQCLSL